jgi:lipopolysaccharide transport system ATP-binding protein
MSNTIIKVENLSKSYLIGHETQGYVALRDIVTNNTKSFAKRLKHAFSGKQLMGGQEIEEFWALKDVSFEIKKGEAVGVIGRNGAGKSTLLKLLSRITEPTKGRIELNGRVASLLEVGTGFHPELTGRENIFLNGAILGMSRAEIKSKFDEIVDFSGVENFLDTPVKRYSSGMYVRLAFAVAAHLEPEILIIDEVLAVGDAEFQKKCLGKMEEVSKSEGKTILFVSHNLSAISNLCNKAILLDRGEMIFSGNVNNTLTQYSNIQKNTAGLKNKIEQNARLTFKEVKIISESIANSNIFHIGDNAKIKITIEINKAIPVLMMNVNIISAANELMAHIINEDDTIALKNLSEGNMYDVTIELKNLMFSPGVYSIDLWTGSSHNADSIYQSSKSVATFEIIQGDIIKRSLPYPSHASVFVKSKWLIDKA